MPTEQPSYRPFSNGTEFMLWCEHNCEQCIKGPEADIQGPNEKCEIENALTLAALCGGTINDPVIGGLEAAQGLAARLNWPGSGPFPFRCAEFQSKN